MAPFRGRGLLRKGAEEGQGHVHIVNCENKKGSKKGESIKRPQLQHTMPSDTQIRTRWLAWPGILCEVVAQGQDGHAHIKKAAVTLCGGFRRQDLNTVADSVAHLSANRLFRRPNSAARFHLTKIVEAVPSDFSISTRLDEPRQRNSVVP